MAKKIFFNPNNPLNIKRYVEYIIMGRRNVYIDSVGETLRYFRKEYRKSRREVAKNIGMVALKYISYECGNTKDNFLNTEYFKKYCEFMEFDKNFFMVDFCKIYKKNMDRISEYVWGKKIN